MLGERDGGDTVMRSCARIYSQQSLVRLMVLKNSTDLPRERVELPGAGSWLDGCRLRPGGSRVVSTYPAGAAEGAAGGAD